jgi:hypothetical protein
MANKITDTKYYSAIADAIRAKNGSSDTYYPADMAQAIEDIPSGGGMDENFAALLAGEASGDLVISGVTSIARTKIQFANANKCNNLVTSLEFPDLEYANRNSGTISGGFYADAYSAPQLHTLRLPKCKMLKIHNTQENDYGNCFQNLATLYTPELNIFDGSLRGSSITSFATPKLFIYNGSNYGFVSCTHLQYADLGTISACSMSFNGSTNLSALVLRYTSVCTLSSTNNLGNTLIASGTGYIYVPRDLVATYQAATNWSTYSAQFRALEDYTDDGTITGEFIMPTN